MAATIVSSMCWVPRGVARHVPYRVQLDAKDLEKVFKLNNFSDEEDVGGIDDEGRPTRKVPNRENGSKGTEIEEAEADSEDKENTEDVTDEEDEGSDKKKSNVMSLHPRDDPYDLASYDNEDAAPAEGLNISNLVVYSNAKDDPLITMHDDDEVDFDEEKAAFQILPNDNMIIAGRAAPDCSILEVYVFNEENGDLYCHHDITLPAFPLATQWLNFDPETKQPGNLVAVGSMEPQISIWDLDVVDMLEPVCVLGEKPKKSVKKRKKSNSSGLTGHTAAVLDLSWHSLAPAALASASADFTAGVWDLNKKEQVLSLTHGEKVQSLEFHPNESSVLLTGAFDHLVRLFDCRQPDKTPLQWKLKGEVERVLWDEFSPFNFIASTESGHIYYMDSRKDKKPIFTIHAHDAAVTGIAQIIDYPNSLVTAGMDSTVRIWDLTDHKNVCIYTKEFNQNFGGITSIKSCPDSCTVLSIGTEKCLTTWDVRGCSSIIKHFKGEDAAQSSSALSQELHKLSLATPNEEDEELREFIDGADEELRGDTFDKFKPPRDDNRSRKNDKSPKADKNITKQRKSDSNKVSSNEKKPSARDAKREIKKAKRRLRREKEQQEASEAEQLFVRS